MTDFLYPFIEADERDPAPLLADLERSATAKADASRRLGVATLAGCAPEIGRAAAAMAERFAAGGRLLAFGNGGSAADAAGLVALFGTPPWGRPLPALSLGADPVVLSALGNDVGFEVVFARQLMAHGRPGDLVVGLSTSGNSANLLAAFAEARRRGMLSVGVAGYGGGRMATASLDHCLVVKADSVHRIQETQSALLFALWSAVQSGLDGRP